MRIATRRLAAKRLAMFDLDGTLTAVRSPFIYVSQALGYGTEAERIASRYGRGEIDFETCGKQIVALWEGTREELVREIVSEIPYRSGAEAFIGHLRRAGVTVGILSVAFQQHVLPRAAELLVDLVRCNELPVRMGCLTGEFSHIVNEINKKDWVRSLQRECGVTAEQTLVAGDTKGDIPMFSVATVSIAVAPESDDVSKAASANLPGDDWNKAVELIEAHWPGWLPSQRDDEK